MTPLAISPPSSTPEPDMSSIPQDAATIPHSATPQVLTGENLKSCELIDFCVCNPDLICSQTLSDP